jgi:carboxymethylenebutenolidase
LLSLSATTFAQTTRPVGPPAEAGAKAALESSPRHGEWAEVTVAEGQPKVKCWVVYPEVKDKAPVVIVIQEIFGLSDWLRATADQLAADGFIAIAPDLLSGKGPGGGGTDSLGGRDNVTKATRDLTPEATNRMLDAVLAYGKTLPASNGRTATVGFCWGGSASFAYAAHNKDVSAAVVAYGSGPRDDADYAKINAPVLGLYGGDDARITATLPQSEAAMKNAGKTYTPRVYPGAGHGFFRQPDGKDGANRRAVDAAWPELVKFIKENAK